MAQLYYCADCNTVLCVWYNKYWHSVQDLAVVKDVLCRDILLRENAKGNTIIGRFNANKS